AAQPDQPAVAAKEPEQPRLESAKQTRLDRYGDPLPEGAIQRLGTLRFRHGGGTINALLVSRDGKTLVTHTYYGSRTVCVWDLATGKLLHQLPGHYEENRAVALSPDGKTLAVGHDALIRFYDLPSGQQYNKLKAPLDEVQGLVFAPDGKSLV